MPGRNDGEFVDFETETVADEPDLSLAVAHEIIGQTGLAGNLFSPFVHFSGVNPFFSKTHGVFNYLTGRLIGGPEFFIQCAHHIDPGFVGDISVISAAVVDEQRHIPFDNVQRRPLADGMGDTDAGDGHICARSDCGRFSVGHIDAHHLLVEPSHTEIALMAHFPAFCGKDGLDVDLPHSFPYDLFPFFEDVTADGPRLDELLYLIGTLYEPHILHGL